jgi:ligand-binding sensor domain-containing protein
MKKFLLALLSLSFLLVLVSACASGTSFFSSGSWQSGGLTHEHIHTLAIDPNNLQNIYAGDTQNGVFASTDGGLHWMQKSAGLPQGSAVNALAFDTTGKKLYAATDSGFFVTTNGGQAWSALPNLPTGAFTALAFDPSSSQTIFAGTQQHGVFISHDGGASWSPINTTLPDTPINGLTYDSSTHQLWAATNEGIYRTGDNGASWQALNDGLPASTTAFDIVPADTFGGTAGLVYAGTDQGFYLSQNNGSQWTTSKSALLHLNIYGVLIDAQNATTIYLATDKVGALRSLDNGQSWGSIAGGLPRGQPVYALAQSATNNGQIFAASNNIYLFPGTNSGLNLSQLFPVLLAIIFFYLLYRLSTRGRKRVKSEKAERS